MRKYVQIDANTDSSIFSLREGHCCSSDMAPEDIVAKVYEKGTCNKDPILEVPFDTLDKGEVKFIWPEELFELCAGWYIVKIENDCRICGEHTLRIGRDCHSKYVKSIGRTHDNCKEECGKECEEVKRKINYCDCEEECCDCSTGQKVFVSNVKYNHE